MQEILKGNAIVGQSGGPTSAINATLSGVIKAAFASKYIDEIYGMKNGIDGVLNDNLVKIKDLSAEDFFALECTPAAALGSCRRKLPSPNNGDHSAYEKIFKLFDKYNIKYFFYIGGNDSMDTVDKIARYAREINYDINVMGIPKTIDNDLPCTDHSPGFGSAAKYVATTLQEIACDCAVYNLKAVTIVEIMGRDAGWLTAAAGLPRLAGQKTADLIYLPETVFDYEDFLTSLRNLLKTKPNIVVAVSEGIKDENGKYIGESFQSGDADIFGHRYLSGTGRVLEGFVKEKLGIKVRSFELSLPQRCAAHCLSACDIEESVRIGREAVRFAEEGEPKEGHMVIFKRAESKEYSIHIERIDVREVANKVYKVNKKYINEERNNVSDELLAHIFPLIQGEICAPREKGLPVHFHF